MTEKKSNSSGIFSLFQRNRQWAEIDGYRVGDLQLDEPVRINSEATVVGNIIAPTIHVAGLVYGSTVARKTILQARGQIWGDVYTGELELAEGGKIQGWVSSLDETGYQAIREEGNIPDIDHQPDSFDMPTNGRSLVRTESQISLLHRLQDEAASALSARRELEQSFNKRLQEVAGETSAKVIILNDRLNQMEEETGGLKEKLAEYEEKLNTRETQAEQQQKELDMTRHSLAERNEELVQLQAQHAGQVDINNKLKNAKNSLEQKLHETNATADNLKSKVKALETALQANVQHSTEQEDALIRWQELAEDTQKRAENMEEEAQMLRQQLEESAHVNERMQEQRRLLEKEWEEAMEQLDLLQRQINTPVAGYPSLEALLDRFKELEEEVRRIPKLKAAAAQLQQQVAESRDRLQTIEKDLLSKEEQLLWYKASLETNQSELQELREWTSQQESVTAKLKQQLEKKTVIAQKWEQATQKARQQLEKQQKQVSILEEQFQQLREQSRLEVRELQEKAKRSQLQLEAQEVELTKTLQEIQEQGERLAEARTIMIERDLELQKTRAKVSKLSGTLQEIKQAAGQRIKELQIELTRTKKQLSE